MFPSPRFVWLFVLPAVLSIAALYGSQYLLAVLALDALLLLALIADALLSRTHRVSVEIHHRDIFSIAESNPIELLVFNRSPRSFWVSLKITLPPSFEAPDQPTRIWVSAGERARTKIHAYPSRRGRHEIGPCFVRIPSRWGLLMKQTSHGSRHTVRVYPDLAKIRTYELLARQHRQYALIRASRLRGGESEFARLRDYRADDDYRLIDWKATARRNVLTTREYQLESDQNIFILLDAGRLMTAEVEGITQFDHALSCSLLLCHVATKGGDRVGLACFDDEIRCFVLPEGGPKTTSRLVAATYSLHPRLTESGFHNVLSAFDTRVKKRSLLVLFTQLIDDGSVSRLAAHLRQLARKHLPLVIVLKDTDLSEMAQGNDSRGSESAELYRQGAAAELLMWQARATKKLTQAGALLLEVPAKDLSSRVINHYLELKAHKSL